MTSPPQFKRINKGSNGVIYVVHNTWRTIMQLANVNISLQWYELEKKVWKHSSEYKPEENKNKTPS